MTLTEDWRQQWQDLMQPGRAEDFFQWKQMPEFNPVGGSFDVGTALWMAEFCRLIYRQEEAELAERRGARTRGELLRERAPEWQEIAFFNGLEQGEIRKRRFWKPALPAEDTQAALLSRSSPDCTVLVFRGTLGIRDLLTDAALFAWPPKFGLKGSVHQGFSDALDTVWSPIRERLISAPGKIFITGHSLGGALATLAARRLLQDAAFAGRVAAVYTFGSPRVGAAGLEGNLEKLFQARVVHEDDLVTKIPAAWSIPPFPKYHHVGIRYLLQNDGQIISTNLPDEEVKDPILETRQLLTRVLKDLGAERLGPPEKQLRDHTPLLYSRALQLAVEKANPR